MIDLVRVPFRDTGQRGFCKRRLDTHDGYRIGLRRIRGFAQEAEHPGHMSQVARACRNGLDISLHVEIAIRESEATGCDTGNHFGGVARVLLNLHTEEKAAASHAQMQTAQQNGEIFALGQRVDAFQVGAQWLAASLLDGCLIHAGGEIIADLLRVRRTVGSRIRRLLQYTPQKMSIVLIQLFINAPARLIRWNGVVLLPTAAGVPIKILAGIDRPIH